MPINKNELTKEMIAKAMECKDADELIALAKTGGYNITKDEADAYLAELADVELDEKTLKAVAGGGCWDDCQSVTYCADCNGHHGNCSRR